MLSAVVTGADGFAARWLCASLIRDGWLVTGWVRSTPLDPIDGVIYRLVDIRDRERCRWAMRKLTGDRVFCEFKLINLHNNI